WHPLQMSSESLTQVEEFKYLGVLFTTEGRMDKSMNIANHHTGMYITETLVVRRGDPIFLKLTFNRPVTAQDNFQVQFRIGQSTFSKVSSSCVQTFFTHQGALMLQVTPAPNAVVGRYRVVVAVALANGLQYTGPELQPSLYLLFNPFNSRDTAFLESGHEEYVMNDSGVIWIGSLNSEYPRPWNYGQFEQGVLEACIYIMDKSQLPISDRGDPVKVVRMASAMINSQDDNGVLVGNWSEDFSMGKSPMFWTGSVQILQQYHSTGVPVSYAQCWVYAGVLNTFMRCLGLASRVITNFLSAHDNDGNLKTDLIFTSDMQPDSRHTRDSIWNYHCWNEVYLRRMDIPEEFSGWQVIDSTPQETSDGNYRCGPASVKAIKIGKVCFPFDGRFIFAEVNSDVLYHTRDRYGKLSLQKVDKKLIGQKLVTKSPHGNYQLDITLEYKYNEGKTWFSPSSVLLWSCFSPMTLSVPPEEYMPFLGSQPNLKITVSVKLPQNEMVTESAVVSLEVLWLNIQVRPETRDQRPETRDQRPDQRPQRTETRKLLKKRPETRDQRPETRDQRPETRDQRPETRPETRDQIRD
uniref:Transglutaminase-like domain-containing protein n=1 Tax=Periophthalmus magnuspinnatus TaxID=409849 RepID=A0A3B4AC55_9GOBI